MGSVRRPGRVRRATGLPPGVRVNSSGRHYRPGRSTSSAGAFAAQFNMGRSNRTILPGNRPTVGQAGRPVFGPNTIPTGFHGNLPRIGADPGRSGGISASVKYGVGRVDRFNRQMDVFDIGPVARGLTRIIRRAAMTPMAAKEYMFALAKWMLVRVFARTPERTGRAKNTWTLQLKIQDDKRIGFSILNNTPYVYYLEFGTQFMVPFSMMAWTVRETRAVLKRTLRTAVVLKEQDVGSGTIRSLARANPDIAAALAELRSDQPFAVFQKVTKFGTPVTRTVSEHVGFSASGERITRKTTTNLHLGVIRPSQVIGDANAAAIWLAFNMGDPYEYAGLERPQVETSYAEAGLDPSDGRNEDYEGGVPF